MYTKFISSLIAILLSVGVASAQGSDFVTIGGNTKQATAVNACGLLPSGSPVPYFSAATMSGYGLVATTTEKRVGVTGLSPNYYVAHITTVTTTNVTSATAYISSIHAVCTAINTAPTFVIQDKAATPQVIVPQVTPVANTVVYSNSWAEPIAATSGISIVTGGSGAAPAYDVRITYWQ